MLRRRRLEAGCWMANHRDFLEIEHKFVVEPDFDVAAFRTIATQLAPRGSTELSVVDSYFVSEREPGLVFRHRFDRERQELTCKSQKPSDTEVRREVNLQLDQAAGNQLAAVAAFLQPFAVSGPRSLTKDILVYYFADCEVVYYTAYTEHKRLHCLEFEALHCQSLAQARAILRRYERRFGVQKQRRVKQSLYDLLLGHQPPPPTRPSALR
jgi:hypothetical protein